MPMLLLRRNVSVSCLVASGAGQAPLSGPAASAMIAWRGTKGWSTVHR